MKVNHGLINLEIGELCKIGKVRAEVARAWLVLGKGYYWSFANGEADFERARGNMI